MLVIKGIKYNRDEYGEIDEDDYEYFKVSDKEVKKILNHIKYIFKVEDFGSGAELLIDNMLKLVE